MKVLTELARDPEAEPQLLLIAFDDDGPDVRAELRLGGLDLADQLLPAVDQRDDVSEVAASVEIAITA